MITEGATSKQSLLVQTGVTEEMCRKADEVLTQTLSIRAALEACESELLAQGMEKAIEAVEEIQASIEDQAFDRVVAAIRASAKHTREGKGP